MGCLPDEEFNELKTQSVCQTKFALDSPDVEIREFKLYYDNPRENKIFYKADTELEIVEGNDNDCVEFLTESLKTDSCGIARLKMQAKGFDCTEDVTVKVCDAQDNNICKDFTVSTTTDESEIDKNHNLMIDEYETNSEKDKNKYTEEMYVPGDCTTFCHDDNDCEDFCDSAIGYRCSTRCTSDDQCIKYKDDDDNWVQMICRKDGRCAYPSFKVKYKIVNDNTEIIMGGYAAGDDVTVDWGDGTEIESIPKSTNDLDDALKEHALTHTYENSGTYTVVITGDYRNWTAGCYKNDDNVGIRKIIQFGPIGLGYIGDMESNDEGAFTSCNVFDEITARDIPDSTKLTNMNSMFAGYKSDGGTLKMQFNQESITRWDTSNVTSMHHTFINAVKFDQDIGKWNTSKVKRMDGMFNTAFNFNQNIGCWDVSNVKDISSMFANADYFNQNLENWRLDKLIKFDKAVSEKDDGHDNLGIENYCALMRSAHGENIGRNTETCWHGATYSSACDNDEWKKQWDYWFDKYLKDDTDLNEDTVACKHIRTIYKCDNDCTQLKRCGYEKDCNVLGCYVHDLYSNVKCKIDNDCKYICN